VTLRNDQDPGWWRRGMTKRAMTIVTVVASAIIVGVLIYIFVAGIPLF